MGELVRLLEVLRGEEDRDPVRDEVANDGPHRPAPARVDAARRLVEEHDARVAHERHRQVEPSLHAARVGRDVLGGRIGQLEAFEEVGDPSSTLLAAEVVEVGHEPEVLAAGQEVVDRRELAGDADGRAHALRVRPQVGTADLDLAGVRREERRQDLDGRRLAGAVGTQQGEHRARRDLDVDPVEDEELAVRLAETGDLDGRRLPLAVMTAPPSARSVRCRSLPRRAA